MNQTKICTVCKIEKELTEFNKQTRAKDGLQYKCRACVKQYCQDNKESIAARNKQYKQGNKGRFVERDRLYRQNNKKEIAERDKQYRQTPKGKAVSKAHYHRRRVQKLNNGGNHTGAQILALFDLQTGICPYCKTKLFKSGKNKYHIDHILPLSKGGTNDISNIQLLCPKCNLSKSDKSPEEFSANFGKLF